MKLLKRTWSDISLDALEANYRMIRNHVGSESKFLAVVKADAYGHGAVPVARAQTEFGAEYLAVSNLEEAVQIRRGGIDTPMLIFGYTPASYADDMVSLNITQEVHSLEYARELNDALAGTDHTLNVHLKLDTGMSRIGFRVYDDPAVLQKVIAAAKLPHLHAEGVFMHFSVSDSKDPDDVAYTKRQHSRFCDALDYLRAEGLHPELCHCCNSGAVLQYPEYAMDMVRPGIASYGIAPSADTVGILPLQPVLSLHTAVSQIRKFPAGTDIGYGRRYRTDKDCLIAVLSVGYADGLPRSLSGKVDFLINGHRAHQVGTICMDACMVDITDIPDVTPGTEATLIGRSGECCQTAFELAESLGTISYELLCGINKRVPRKIKHHGNTIELLQYIV
jgi:alanine racemase